MKTPTKRRYKDFICMGPHCEASSPREDKLEDRLAAARVAGWTVWRDRADLEPGDCFCPDHKPPTK